MGAQRPRHEVGAAVIQPLLEQAVGQQIGRDHHAARTPATRGGDGIADGRSAGRCKSQFDRRPGQR